MEENICILMSDLSGYTALTEVHGAVSAADLIDRYIEIIKDCLVGDCHLQERTGDEVMVVSSNPDFLLATAVRIINSTSNEHNFLQVHGGIHYGKVLKRGNSYFGSAINLTSRIASKASPGTFWCSKDFIETLRDRSNIKLEFKGKHNFKNLSGFMEMYELTSENSNPAFIDSVCRMLILDIAQATKHPKLKDIFFCSPACLNIYLKNQSTNSEVN